MRLKHFNLAFGTQIFKAFSDVSRTRILHLLYQNKEMCITDIELVLDFTQTKTSRHLNYLKNAGITRSRKIDQWAMYTITEEVSEVTERIFSWMERDPVLVKDQENYRILYSNRELAANKLHNRRYTAGN